MNRIATRREEAAALRVAHRYSITDPEFNYREIIKQMVITGYSKGGGVHRTHSTQGVDIFVGDSKDFRAVCCHVQSIIQT